MKYTGQEILIVDDRKENLLALEKILAETGSRLVKALSGEQALAATLERDFALAILDVQMPGMDGYELAELLRGDAKTKNMPIIFLTAAYSEEAQIFKGYESGAVDYIVKPYNPTILVSKVSVFLEMHAQQEALRRHRERLAAVNEELEAFAYSVSHDLQAPLRVIKGYGQALLEDCLKKLNNQEQDYLHRVLHQAGRMSQLIDDLLALSRVTRAEMTYEPVDLSKITREISAHLREAEPGRNAVIRIADNLTALGDPRLIYQALDNLLANAWKFTKHRGQTEIELGLLTRNGEPIFFVQDNGAGFDMKYADKLCAPFQRLHSNKAFPGTGIGLSTVHRIVKRHGGRLWFESEVDKGATFYFTLKDIEKPQFE
ncbi:MAG: response regulator [Myxococcota bacterium]|nr:response regulator [Myxococcota bacterium]